MSDGQEPEVAAGVSEVEASAAIYPVWPDAAAIIATGLSDETKESLTKAGFLTVGAFREAVRSKLEDGGCVQDLPGVTPENSAEIEAKLLNDRPAGNYLTGESAGEVPVANEDRPTAVDVMRQLKESLQSSD